MTSTPNILFVLSDQQRWDTMGCYGQRLPVTPNLDTLAADGVRFEHTFTCQPVCGPARAALQTGKWASQTGCFKNGVALPPSERTLAHYLGEAGCEVGYCGKWHLASQGKEQDFRTHPVPPHLRGGYEDFWCASDVLECTSHGHNGCMFDSDGRRRNFAPGQYRVDFVTDCALEFLRRSRVRPFFLFVSYLEPHHQNDHGRCEGPAGSAERFGSYDVPGDLQGTKGDWQTNYPDYLGCCWSLDQNFARLRSELVTQGQWENTLVVYTSDHGCHFRTRNAEYKRSCHDSSLRIPLIIRGPGFRGGRVVRELVSLLDLPPTLLAAGGLTPAASMVGLALQPLAVGSVAGWRDYVYAEISEDHIGRVIRTDRWKFAIRAPAEGRWSGASCPSSNIYHDDCLYELAVDPHERSNLVREPKLAAVRADLRRRLMACMAAAHEGVPSILPATSTEAEHP